MNEVKKDKFNLIETVLFKLYTYIVIFGVIMFAFLITLQERVIEVFQYISWVFIIGVYVLIIIFLIAVIQLFRYLFSGKEKRILRSIKKSIIIVLTSPISIFIYWMLAFVLLLSMASCS